MCVVLQCTIPAVLLLMDSHYFNIFTGTAFTNTECGNCPEGSYSNGSFITCHPHSKLVSNYIKIVQWITGYTLLKKFGHSLALFIFNSCEKEGRKEKTPGTASSDVECEDSVPVAVIVGAAVGVGFLLIVGIAIYFILKHKKTQNSKRGITFKNQIILTCCADVNISLCSR